MNGAVNKGSFDVVCDGLTYHSFLKENDDFVDAYFAYTSETGGQRVVFYATGTNTDGTNRYAQRTDTGPNPAAIVFTMIEENVGKSLYNLFTEVMMGENCSITKDSEKVDVNITSRTDRELPFTFRIIYSLQHSGITKIFFNYEGNNVDMEISYGKASIGVLPEVKQATIGEAIANTKDLITTKNERQVNFILTESEVTIAQTKVYQDTYYRNGGLLKLVETRNGQDYTTYTEFFGDTNYTSYPFLNTYIRKSGEIIVPQSYAAILTNLAEKKWEETDDGTFTVMDQYAATYEAGVDGNIISKMVVSYRDGNKRTYEIAVGEVESIDLPSSIEFNTAINEVGRAVAQIPSKYTLSISGYAYKSANGCRVVYWRDYENGKEILRMMGKRTGDFDLLAITASYVSDYYVYEGTETYSDYGCWLHAVDADYLGDVKDEYGTPVLMFMNEVRGGTDNASLASLEYDYITGKFTFKNSSNESYTYLFGGTYQNPALVEVDGYVPADKTRGYFNLHATVESFSFDLPTVESAREVQCYSGYDLKNKIQKDLKLAEYLVEDESYDGYTITVDKTKNYEYLIVETHLGEKRFFSNEDDKHVCIYKNNSGVYVKSEYNTDMYNNKKQAYTRYKNMFNFIDNPSTDRYYFSDKNYGTGDTVKLRFETDDDGNEYYEYTLYKGTITQFVCHTETREYIFYVTLVEDWDFPEI